MKFPITHKKQTASFRIAGWMLAIAPLWLMLASANTSVQAQTSDDVSNSSATASTTPSPSLADWTQFLRDNMQRWNPYETVLGVGNVGSLQLKWKNPIGGTSGFAFNTSPAVVNGVVYVGSDDGNVYALNASTGAKLWSYAVGGPEGSPAVANGVVYIVSQHGIVYALNANTGAKLWSDNSCLWQASPAVANGVVYVTSIICRIYAFNASTGATLWSFDALGSVMTTPAVANGMVYFGTDINSVYALNASTGEVVWSYGTESLVFSWPEVANGVVYVGDWSGTLYALNASTGAKLWTIGDAGSSLRFNGPSAIANGVVYAGGDALNASTGVKLWSFAEGGASAVANGVVYGSGGSNLYAWNASTGAKLWSFDTGVAAYFSSLTVVNGVVYIHAGDNVYAFSVGADLFLRIRPTTTTVHQGDLLTYAFPVWNLGPENADQEVLNTQVPAGTTFDYIRISGTPGLGTCTHSPYQGTGPIVCHENSAMAPNTTWTVRLTVKVTAPAGTVITENAATMADSLDPNLANNTATASVNVLGGSADLFLRVTPSTTTVHQGDLLTYAFPVWNLGPNNADFEVLHTQVPAGTTFDSIRISGTPGLGTCTNPPFGGTGQIVCHENSSMAPNTTWTVRLTVKVTAPGGTVINESAATTADSLDPNLANNTATVSLKVQ